MNDVLPLQAGKHAEDVTLLAKSSVLAHLGVRDLGTFLDTLDQLALPAGTTVFREAEVGDQMYFVLDGHVRVRRGSIDTARLGRGDHFGELAILGVARRTTTAFTETPVRLARLSRSRFLSLATSHPRVALHVTEAIAASLAATLTAMTDDVGLLLRQRTLPRRSTVRVMVSGGLVDVAMGTPAITLLPQFSEGALVVAASIDHRPVSLETPVTSDAHVEPITVASWEGRRIYRGSVGILLLEAARSVLPQARVSLGPRCGEALRVIWPAAAMSPENVAAVEQRMRELAMSATPIREELWTVEEARARLTEQGWNEAASLIPFYKDKTISLLSCGGTYALGLGPVMPNARALQGFSLALRDESVLLDFGDALRPHTSTKTSAIEAVPSVSRSPAPAAHAMSRELTKWLTALGVESVGQFNRACVAGQVGELIRVSEGFHEKNIGRIADRIAGDPHLRVVAIAGPSSSGKTTFIKRLKVQLEVNGVTPVHLSLDDYYVDRDRTPKDESGEYDFEAAAAIDGTLFRSHVARLLSGERVRTARFDFKTGQSVPEGGLDLALSASSVLLVEGLHALNPEMLASVATRQQTFRAFVHPATALPFDRLSSVLPEDVRLIRRIVRDRHQRNYLASESIQRWPSVRRGEVRHIFPCVPEADVVFDSSLVYELAVLRVYAERYLLEILEQDPTYATAYRLRQLIDRFVPIHPDHVPPTSILREFIGGSGFDG
jgi:uridine kinase